MCADNKKHAFTLVELLIVVSILGILAAIIMPTFRSHVQQAKESAAKDNLQILRNAIELYTAQHNDTPPGYLDGVLLSGITLPIQFSSYTNTKGMVNATKTAEYKYGPYLKKFPRNPFNDRNLILEIADDAELPESPTGDYGWIYKPATKDIRLDWPGTDSEGVSYYDY